MPKARRLSSATVKARNKAARLDAYRAQLRADFYVREVHKILALCAEDNPNKPIDAASLARARIRLDAACRMLNKCLPDLKAIGVAELEKEEGAGNMLAAIAEATTNSPIDHIKTLQQLDRTKSGSS